MTSPKHLWSGDWRQESADAARERVGRELPPGQPAEPQSSQPKPAEAQSPRASGLRRALAPAVLVAVALAALLIAGAYGVSALVDSGGSGATSATNASGPAPWLGAQMESLPLGGVVIATVSTGGPAERAGLEPGDVITELNRRAIDTVGDVQRAVGGLRAGNTIQIQVSRGSTIYNTDVTLAAQPRGNP